MFSLRSDQINQFATLQEGKKDRISLYFDISWQISFACSITAWKYISHIPNEAGLEQLLTSTEPMGWALVCKNRLYFDTWTQLHRVLSTTQQGVRSGYGTEPMGRTRPCSRHSLSVQTLCYALRSTGVCASKLAEELCHSLKRASCVIWNAIRN